MIKYFKNNIDKNIIKYYIIIIFLVIIPIFYVLIFDVIKDFKKFNSFQGLLGIIPFILTGLQIFITQIKDYKKEQNAIKEKERINKENEKREIDGYIYKFDKIITKAIANYNVLMNDFYLINTDMNNLKSNPFLFVIIDLWERNTKNTISLSNNEQFRAIIREQVNVIIEVYKKNSDFDYIFEYLCSLSSIFEEQDDYSISEKVFVHFLRNYLLFSKKEKQIIGTYIDLFNNGKKRSKVGVDLKIALENFKECYRNETKPRSVNGKILTRIFCNLLYKLFGYCEVLLLEIYFLQKFQDLLEKYFSEYYNIKKVEFDNKLLVKNSIEIVAKNPFIDKFIDEKVIYKHYGIIDDEEKPDDIISHQQKEQPHDHHPT